MENAGAGPRQGPGSGDESLWSGLDEAAHREIVASMRRRKVLRGETLIEHGADSDTLFIVNFGQFEVRSASTGRIVAHIGAGQLVGEIGFFASDTRTGTVVAARDSEVLEISRDEFDALCIRLPEVHRAVSRSLAVRLRRLAIAAHAAPASPSGLVRVIAVVAAGGGPAPGAFVDALAAQAGRRAAVRVVRAEDALAQGRGERFDAFAVADWLASVERAHDLVICIADPDLSDWTQIALRAADQLLIVASGSPAPLGAAEKFGLDLFPPLRRRLALLHDRRRVAVGAVAPWLREREVAMVHHVSLQDSADVARLARFLLGRAVGLVAGGGGGFGPAHVGIVRALRERGVEFDICGGSSVGAIMAAAFAALMPLDEIARKLDDAFVRNHALRRVTWPRYGLLDHSVLDAQLKTVFGDAQIEDLWKPYFALAADLSTFSARLQQKGSLWRAVRASIAIPGALPPFFDADGHMLVDGGVVDNVPLSAMKSLKAGCNVVIDLRPQTQRFYDVPYDSIPGRRALLAHIGNPLKWADRLPPCPNPVSVVQHAMFGNFQDPASLTPDRDLLLKPPAFPGSSTMNWDRHADVLAASYEWGLSAIDDLVARRDPAFLAVQDALA